MRPCAKNRKLIAWLTLDALEVQQARDLRAHIETCDGCRRYLEEMSTVAQSLRAAQTRSDLQAAQSFHQRVTGALRAAAASGENRGWRIQDGNHGSAIAGPSLWGTLMASFRGIGVGWRVALAVLGAIALAIVLLSPYARHSRASSPAVSTAPARRVRDLDSEISPTIANYELVASRSLEQFDELLTRQANRKPPSAPIYTASTLPAANFSD